LKPKFWDYAKTFKVGNGMDPEVKVGPLVSNIQLSHVQAQVNSAVEDGAKLLYQSDIPDTNTGASFFPVQQFCPT
jgi:acyl-CoA reductase-like NAD-dependent aldehyde dehydrogenase